MLREHSDGVIRTFMEPDSLVVHMNQPCQPIPVTFDMNAYLLLSPVGDVTYLRQHLVLMMWINVLCELGREHRYHYHETWNRMWTHIFRDEMLLHSPTWPCSLYHHTSYWLLWKEAQAYRNCSATMGGHSFKQLPEDFAKGWPKWIFHSPVPSIMPQWVMPLEIVPLAKHNRVTPAQLFLVVMLS